MFIFYELSVFMNWDQSTLNASYYSVPFPSALLCVVHYHSVLGI